LIEIPLANGYIAIGILFSMVFDICVYYSATLNVRVDHKSNVELWTNVIDFDEIIVKLIYNILLMISKHIVTM
jgi:hypothetical protein